MSPDGRLVAAVGHEPHLGLLIGYLATGQLHPFIELRKGGAALLEFDGGPSAGSPGKPA